MSVQIAIQRRNGSVVFTPAGQVQQSDLVFWFNGDTQSHFPIPGCAALRVPPGGTTPPYQPFPDRPVINPIVIEYVCALHPGEASAVGIQPDPAPPLAGPPGNNPQTVPIRIARSGGSVTFATVELTQADFVVWQNDDTEEHWPVPNCTGLRVEPGKTSNPVQLATSDFPRSAASTGPYGGPPALPQPIAYGCALHDGESGTINVYDSLAVLPGSPAATLAGVNVPAPLVTGGKSPYTIVQDPTNPNLQLVETEPAGSSSGVSVVLTKQQASGTVTLQVQVTDALGRNLNTTAQITI